MKELEARQILMNMSKEQVESYSIKTQKAWERIHNGSNARLISAVVREITLSFDADYIAWCKYRDAVAVSHKIFAFYSDLIECSINDWNKAFAECSGDTKMSPDDKAILSECTKTMEECRAGFLNWQKITGGHKVW